MSSSFVRWSLLALFVMVGAACGRKIVVNGIEVYEGHWIEATQQLSSRASFELQCPAPQLQFTLFRRVGRSPTEVGVTGCGRRAMYIRPVAGGYMGPWILSTEARGY